MEVSGRDRSKATLVRCVPPPPPLGENRLENAVEGRGGVAIEPPVRTCMRLAQ